MEDFAQVYAEKEARGRVIDALHQEATMWMDRFATTTAASDVSADFPGSEEDEAMIELNTNPNSNLRDREKRVCDLNLGR